LNGVGTSVNPSSTEGMLTAVAKKFNVGALANVNLNANGERKFMLSG
jgi:hypothetical protein